MEGRAVRRGCRWAEDGGGRGGRQMGEWLGRLGGRKEGKRRLS